MLTERQKEILKIIVDEYIHNVQPVSSKTIIEKYQLNYSAATIRSECAFLKEIGLLEKTHISSGRTPSSKGYRYYVDHLMNHGNASDIKDKLENIFANRQLAIDEVLNQTAVILSEMTNLVTVIIDRKCDDDVLKKIELVPLTKDSVVAIFITKNGYVSNKTFKTSETDLNDLVIAIKLFNQRLTGVKINQINEQASLIQPILKQQVKKYEYLFQTFVSTLLNFNKFSTKTHGIKYMLDNPEFNDVRKIKEIIRFVEEFSPWEQFANKTNNSNVEKDINKTSPEENVNIYIGDELGPEQSDISLITLKYNLDHARQGQLALVGPKRLDYDKMVELLEWISKKISENF